VRASDGRHGFAEGDVVGINEAQVGKSEIGYGARGRAYVERVARRDEDDCEFGGDVTIVARWARRVGANPTRLKSRVPRRRG